MSDTHSQMAKELADSMTASVSAPGTYSLGGVLSQHNYANTSITNNGAVTATPWTGPYTITSGTGITNPWATHATPKIKLDGEGADIEVNGESLMGLLKQISERLNLITINEKMEKEWKELRELGNKYRELEQHIKDKQATWDKLKAMPPPETY